MQDTLDSPSLSLVGDFTEHFESSNVWFDAVEEVTERDKFMSPDEAKDFGIIDNVLSN